ncbi:MAG: restriction endonuclease [Rhodospirillaceae bacterium]|nr:restriction endonuclease [Rhodospirillaceae bacterium]
MTSQRLIPQDIDDRYEVREWRNGLAILAAAHRDEWDDIQAVLRGFHLLRSDILTPGGRKSGVATKIDSALYARNWREKSFDTKIVVDGVEHIAPTHKVDCFKNRVALEVEWNNKDPFYDRDLTNFRLLFELRTVDVGVIITRCDELQTIFDSLGRGASYGASTTHMSKLLPRLEGGGGGGCPVVAFGIGKTCYVES